jgi:hypothetical protein
MTRINIAATRDFVAWGKSIPEKVVPTSLRGNINALVFAAVLIVCSFAVGCSSEKPKPVNSNNQVPVSQTPSPAIATPAPVMQAENKPVTKKPVQHKKPATVNYSDKTYGVTFEYPRRYAIETGNAATDVLSTSPIPMNFIMPGGTALAAVELPQTGFANTDFSSAYFDVSVNKNVSADQCNQFAVPAPRMAAATESKPEPQLAAAASMEPAKTETQPQATSSTQPESGSAEVKPEAAQPEVSAAAASTSVTTSDSKSETKPETAQAQPDLQGSKLLLGDMELRATEAVSGEGTRQSDAKYFHIYQNGACYEFALNVTTVASEDGLIKHVDRDKVFSKLEKILDTVKISPVTAAEVPAETPATAVAAETPAQ